MVGTVLLPGLAFSICVLLAWCIHAVVLTQRLLGGDLFYVIG